MKQSKTNQSNQKQAESILFYKYKSTQSLVPQARGPYGTNIYSSDTIYLANDQGGHP